MSFHLSAISLANMAGVHPNLEKVVKSAIVESATDFRVICGVRTIEEQVALYAQGRTTAEMIAAGIPDVEGRPQLRKVTWTLKSLHFIQKSTGYGHAVDLAAMVAGDIMWEPPMLYERIAIAMKAAARKLNVPIEWGGDWPRKDLVHFQLPKGYGS